MRSEKVVVVMPHAIMALHHLWCWQTWLRLCPSAFITSLSWQLPYYFQHIGFHAAYNRYGSLALSCTHVDVCVCKYC